MKAGNRERGAGSVQVARVAAFRALPYAADLQATASIRKHYPHFVRPLPACGGESRP